MKKYFVIVFVLVLSFTVSISAQAAKKSAEKKVVDIKITATGTYTSTAVPTAVAVTKTAMVATPGAVTKTAMVATPSAVTSTAKVDVKKEIEKEIAKPIVVETQTSVTTNAKAVVTSPTATVTTVAAVKPEVGLIDHLQLGLRFRSFNGLNTLTQPIGFATESSDQNSILTEFSIQVKIGKFALECLPIASSRVLSTEFYGASLGEVTVTTSNVWIGKFFPIDTPEYSVSVGLGLEYTSLSGAVSMGGFKFPTTGDGYSPIFQIGGVYHLNNRCSLGIDYERSNIKITTEIPDVPHLVSTFTDRLSVRVMLGLF